MKKILKIIGFIIVILLIILIGLIAYIYVNLKPFLMSPNIANVNQASATDQATGTAAGGDKHPLLNEQQEQTLENFGIDPAKLPTQITPQLEACFTEKLGAARVKAIQGGEQPNVIDFFKAKSCLTN